MNRLVIGSLAAPSFSFDNESIRSIATEQTVALVGQNLCYDTLAASVSDDDANLHDMYRFRSSDGHEIETATGQIFVLSISAGTNVSPLIDLPRNTPIWYYQDQELIGKFFLTGVQRTAPNLYKLSAVSAVGTLDEAEHGGGLFTASTFGAVLQHILAADPHGGGDSIMEYVIDDDVAALPVSGWLPRDTKRNNLYRLIFGNGVNITKNIDGKPRFTFLYPSPTGAPAIDNEIIYNEGSVSYDAPYKRVVVTEHTYTPDLTQDAVTLFDNSEGEPITNAEIWFSQAPVIVSTLDTTGTLTVVSATVNSAIVSGSGELKGVPYVHSMRAVSMGDVSAPEEKTIRVSEDATMVNTINSENLLSRLYAFYCPATYIQKMTNGVVWDGQRPGKAYRLSDPFGAETTAFLASMNIRASAVNKAECEWYVNYAPAGQAGLYQHVAIIVPIWDEENEEWVYDGEWTVPEGVTEFKAVLIGGGTGGYCGWPGKNGGDARTYTYVRENADLSAIWYGAEGGDGGAGGNGGAPGRVKVVTVQNATPGDVYEYSLGEGGEGGAASGWIPDTLAELRAALENEDPDTEYTDAQINAMIAVEQEVTDWNGSPNAGSAGTATTFGIDGGTTYSTADNDGYVPTGGVYEPITDQYFALTGKRGIAGGKGGARKVEQNGSFNWITDGADVQDAAGVVYHGGRTGTAMTRVSGLPEASINAYGGNGAGAAVGLDRADHPHMDGGSDQSAEWEVLEENGN